MTSPRRAMHRTGGPTTVRHDARRPDRSAQRHRPTLAVAYDISSSSPLELVEALDRACDLVWVVDASDPGLGSWSRLLPRLGPVVDVAGRSVDDVAAELATHGVDSVLAFTDSQLLRAALLTAALGFEANTPEVVLGLTDKVVQRQTLARAGVPGPRFVGVDGCATVASAAARIAHLDYPVVIKPRRGSGSQDTVRVEDHAAAVGHLTAVLAEGRCPDLIVEEWLGGLDARGSGPFADYVSVEAVARAGEVVPLAVTGKFALADPCRETGNFLPHVLERDEAEAVVDLAARAAVALGVRSGALHIEVMLTTRGPMIIEINGRVGGGAIDTLYASLHGRSLTQVAAAVAFGDPIDLPVVDLNPSSGPFAYAYFVQAPVDAHRLTGLGNLDAVQELEGVVATSVNRTLDDRLDWRDGSMGYLLSVRGSAPGPEDLARVPGRVDDLLDLHFGEDPPSLLR